MRRALAFVLFSVVSPFTASAEPMGFKTYTLGSDLKEQVLIAGLTCMPERRGVTTCGIGTRAALADAVKTIAGVPVERIYFMGTGGRLGDITVNFPATGFDDVLQAYQDRYPALACEKGEVQNRMGATFDQVTCIYRAPDGARLKLEKRSRTVDTAEMAMTTAEMMEAFSKSSEKGKEAARKDI